MYFYEQTEWGWSVFFRDALGRVWQEWHGGFGTEAEAAEVVAGLNR